MATSKTSSTTKTTATKPNATKPTGKATTTKGKPATPTKAAATVAPPVAEPVKVAAPVTPPAAEPTKSAAPTEATQPAKSTLSGNMLDTLKAMEDGNAMTHNAIAAITKRDKGNKLRELTAAGLVTTAEQEGTRGFVYALTVAGKQAIADAK